MKPYVQFSQIHHARPWLTLLLAAFTLTHASPSAWANVFASNLQLNSTLTNLVVEPGAGITIDYLLNQPADAGVVVAVAVGTNVVWSTNLTSTTGGTNRGVNSVVWDGYDHSGNVVSNGLWRVFVTAVSAGTTNWTSFQLKDNILQTMNGDGYVWSPQGIAVNNNTNSPYFGRIFVGNSEPNEPATHAGDLVGIAKYNADGSYADEGAHSTGGWAWAGDGSSPWRIEVGEDDRVYVVDGAAQCSTLSFDQLISTNTPVQQALQAGNRISGAVHYAGLAVTGAGTNRQLYMSDDGFGSPGGVGVRRWKVQASGAAAAGDLGSNVAPTSVSYALDRFPQDVAVDSSNRIFVIQNILDTSSSARVLAYPPYQGSALTMPYWTVTNQSLIGASGIAAALHTNWLAVVCRQDVGSAISLFNRDTGASVSAPGLNSGATYEHDYTDVAWDRAGNLYVTDWAASRWRVYSPPGTNKFTTVSLQSVKIGPYVAPILQAKQRQAGQFQFQLSGEPGVNYVIETTTNLLNWSAVTTNQAPAVTSVWTVPAPASKAFFRARPQP
jgi:hypothetical protein